MTDFSVVRQPSDPNVRLCIEFFCCSPTLRLNVRLYFRILGVSHTDGMSPIYLLTLYSKKLFLSTYLRIFNLNLTEKYIKYNHHCNVNIIHNSFFVISICLKTSYNAKIHKVNINKYYCFYTDTMIKYQGRNDKGGKG